MTTVNETQREFRIHGLHCAGEVAILKREFGPLVEMGETLTGSTLVTLVAPPTAYLWLEGRPPANA